ncbi:uncharacterized protein [Spinacia oleracea]|uniref:Uncharacterized protein isoform X2 n=1 Tax=Spinacia oleracea TaxID=3562 RepID=A0ABM3QSD3_SPIOL|nr:uncharacterized protein LOC110805060 isoform X2 [Spinacia oleracea]
MARRKADWSELYPELLSNIASRLQTRGDFNHFRSVCKNWRSSSSILPHQNLPYLSPLFLHTLSPISINLCHASAQSSLRKYSYSVKIVANSTVLLQPKNPNPNCTPRKPWLITVEEFNPGDLVYVRLNDGNDNRDLRCHPVSKFDDIVNYKGMVWAIDRRGRPYVVHFSDVLKLVLFSNHTICNRKLYTDSRKRLVESSDGLYMIDRYHEEDWIKFRVYKLNEEECKWNEIDSLGGRILFVLSDCCFFGNAEDFPGCGRNCIYFPRGQFMPYNGNTYPDSYYFMGATKELEIGVFHLDDGESELVSTSSGYSSLLWPPPKWLFPGWDGEEDEITLDLNNNEIHPSSLSNFSALDVIEQPVETGVSDQQLQGPDVPWADIPSDLLTEIAKYLESRADVCVSRAVCTNWRASFSLPLNSSILCSMLPYKISNTLPDFISKIRPFHLVTSIVYLIHPCSQSLVPSKSWLVTIEELNPGKLTLLLPLRRAAIKDLPENFPKFLSLSDLHVTEISREYNFQNAEERWCEFSSSDCPFDCGVHSVQKVVLFSNKAPPTIAGTTAFILGTKGSLVALELGNHSDKACWLVRCGSVYKFDDILNFKGQVYGIDRKGRVYIISYNEQIICRITNDAIGTGQASDRHKRLVEFRGELYVLTRYSPEMKISFCVYKLNEEQHKWDQVTSLGNKILFVTPNVCFFVSSRDCPGWKGNCIVFPVDSLPSYTQSSRPDMRFFRRASREFKIGVFYMGQTDGAKLIRLYPGYSDLFWPPPSWLSAT